MSLIQSPETILLVHRTMVQEELIRRGHPRRGDLARRPRPLLTIIRSGVGRALIAMGTRIEPAPRTNRTQPEMGTLSIAR